MGEVKKDLDNIFAVDALSFELSMLQADIRICEVYFKCLVSAAVDTLQEFDAAYSLFVDSVRLFRRTYKTFYCNDQISSDVCTVFDRYVDDCYDRAHLVYAERLHQPLGCCDK